MSDPVVCWPQNEPYNKLVVDVRSIGGNTVSLKIGPLPFEISADAAVELAAQLSVATLNSRTQP
jgi:hypothetical protein